MEKARTEKKDKKYLGPAETSLWKVRDRGYFKLLFYEFPDAQSILPPFPINIQRLKAYRQALWIGTGQAIDENKPAFQGQIWLPPTKAFSLYEFVSELFYSEAGERSSFKLFDDNKSVYFNRGEKSLLVVSAISQRGAGRFSMNHQEVFMFGSMLKNYANLALVLWYEEDEFYVELRRFGEWLYFTEPFMANITTQEADKLKDFLRAYLEETNEQKNIRPVFVKNLYTFRYIETENLAYLIHPYGKIPIDKNKARKILLLL